MLRRQHYRSQPETTGGKRERLAVFALEELTLGWRRLCRQKLS
jgi:hypothetical protein